MRKKVVFIADCLITQKAGIHFYAEQFIQRTLKEYPGNEYFIIVPSAYGKFDCQELIIPINSKIPFHYRFRYFNSIPNKCKEINADVVIEMAHFGPFNLKRNTTSATVIHDLTPITHPQWHNKASTIGHKKFLPKVMETSEFIISNSETTKASIRSEYEFPSDKILVCPPLVAGSKQDSKASIEKENVILAVGTIEPRKNYNTLIKAYNNILERYPDYRLVIAGDWGWKSESTKQLIESSSSQIHLTGYVSSDKLNQLYASSKLFVFPSLYEGYGIPLVEAMKNQLPIVASDIPSSQEVCGSAAIYFSKEDSSSLSDKLIEILASESLQESLAVASHRRFIQLSEQKLQLDPLLY